MYTCCIRLAYTHWLLNWHWLNWQNDMSIEPVQEESHATIEQTGLSVTLEKKTVPLNFQLRAWLICMARCSNIWCVYEYCYCLLRTAKYSRLHAQPIKVCGLIQLLCMYLQTTQLCRHLKIHWEFCQNQSLQNSSFTNWLHFKNCQMDPLLNQCSVHNINISCFQ